MLRRLVPVLAAGIVLAACSGGGDSGADALPATTSPAAAATSDVPADVSDAPAAAPDALQFASPLVGGGDIELTTLAGRPVLLWFWAPW